MKINIYISQKKKSLKISIFLFKVQIDLKSWLIVPKGQLRVRQLFLNLNQKQLSHSSGQQIYLIFRLSTNFIDHNDEMGHFVKHIFLVFILKVNVKREI